MLGLKLVMLVKVAAGDFEIITECHNAEIPDGCFIVAIIDIGAHTLSTNRYQMIAFI